ncbi:hypothetical protein B0T16DRAFT_171216 [Cercophora newfieldiana]|uniref:Uncharacterized protein n=1 Tax=Cercophora newfieldiana TaxID=92897 RepID=A0AA39Y8H3_9PEZI|nr:hypothetical protein B0T16DRAFT_171216 [Cercophora newfieldiana]
MSKMPPRSQKIAKTTSVSDAPRTDAEYKPVPLRWWYLSTVLCYICVLCLLLELSFSKLPQVNNRRLGSNSEDVPNPLNSTHLDSTFNTVDTLKPMAKRSTTIRRPRSFNGTMEGFNSTANATSSSSASGNKTLTPPSNQTTDLGRPDTSTKYAGRDQYADLLANAVIIRYRLNTVWVHDSTGWEQVPVFPDMDVSDRCVSYKVDHYFTDNPQDYRALVLFDRERAAQLGPRYANVPASVFFCFEEGEPCNQYHRTMADSVVYDVVPEQDCWNRESSAGTTFTYPKRTTEGSRALVTTSVVTQVTLPPTTSTLATIVTNPDGKISTSILTTTIPGRVVATTMPITTLVDAPNRRVATVGGTVMTLFDSLGRPTATTTSLSSGTIPQRTTTLFDAQGRPTATQTLDVSLSTTLVTLYDPDTGKPTATATQYLVPIPTTPPKVDPSSIITVYPLSRFAYYAASFLPVLLATILAIPIQVLNRTLREMAPFTALSRSDARYKDSLGLKMEGSLINDPLGAVRSAFKSRQPLLLMSDLLVVLGMVVTSLASEGVGATLQGECLEQSFRGCWMSLAVVKAPARAGEGILIAMGVIALGMLVLAGRWSVRVRGDPRSLAGVAGLLTAEDGRLRTLMREVEVGKMKQSLGGYRFKLENGGVVVAKADDRAVANKRWWKRGWNRGTRRRPASDDGAKSRSGLSTILLEHGSRALLLAVLCTMLTIVVYYGSEKRSQTDRLEVFMNSQTAGVAFLFTAAGTFIDLFWDHLYSRCEMHVPYRRLSSSHPSLSAELTRLRSSNIFSGFCRAVKHRDWLIGAVAFAGLLAKSLPLLLSNIPFRLTLTWTTFVTCTWMSVAFMAVMILVVLVLLLIRQPPMPVDPGTLAGQMYYVCDSWILMDLQGFANMDAAAQARYLSKIGALYRFGAMVGVSGRKRIGVDYVD